MSKLICRLCLRTSLDSLPILEGDLKATLDNLLLKSIVSVSQHQNMVCSECRNNLLLLNHFKTECVNARDMRSSAYNCRSDVGLDMNEIDNEQIKAAVQHPNKCNFCTEIVVKPCFVLQNDFKKYMFLMNLLEQCVQVLDLNGTETILCCKSCSKTIQKLQSFITNCFNVEEKIQKYVSVEGIDDNDKIDLEKVQEFKFKPTLELETGCSSAVKMEAMDRNQGLVIKSDPELKCEKGDDPEPIIKHEEVDIKSEDSENVDESKVNMEPQISTRKAPSKRKMQKCKDCPYETIYTSSMKMHVLTHKDPSEIIIHKCEICTYETKFQKYFRQHMLTHKDRSERKKYKCNECPHEAMSPSNLSKHRMTHLAIAIHKCELCTYESKRSESLRQHMMTHKDPSERRKYKCKDCPCETMTKVSMELHVAIHKDSSYIAMHKCEICMYETKRRQGLREHMLTHRDRSERKKYRCKECPYETITRVSMKRHAVTHKDPSVTPLHKCTVCPFETRYSYYMKQHTLTHKDPSERKKYKCNDCAFETIYRTSLKRHVVSHEDSLEQLKCEASHKEEDP